MEPAIDSYKVETYALFVGTDNTVLKLNPLIASFGYEFRSINLEEFERDFSEIILLPKMAREETIVYHNTYKISQEFQTALTHHYAFGVPFIVQKSIDLILLKRIVDIESKEATPMSKPFADLHKFSESILHQLRLFKYGDIKIPQTFQMRSDTRRIFVRSWEPSVMLVDTYTLTDDECERFAKSFSLEFKPNALSELSINTFHLTYAIRDIRIRFMTLITCLECIFNTGKDQIAHTIARHSAILLSSDPSEFHDLYKKIKKFYHLRSQIVHGGRTDHKVLQPGFIDLSDIVRQILNHCNKLSVTKDELFADLNSRGFPA